MSTYEEFMIIINIALLIIAILNYTNKKSPDTSLNRVSGLFSLFFHRINQVINQFLSSAPLSICFL